jgi:hypothetical protein
MKLTEWNTLDAAAEWLSEESGELWKREHVLAAMASSKAPILLAYAALPEDIPIISKDTTAILHGDRLVPLPWLTRHMLSIHDSAELNSIDLADAKGGDTVHFSLGHPVPCIGTQHVRLRKSDLQNYLDFVGIDGTCPSQDNGLPWLTKHQLSSVFAPIYRNSQYWKNATSKRTPQWLESCCRKASPGDKSGGSTYNPVKVAIALIQPPHLQPIQRMNRAFKSSVFDPPLGLSGWRGEWDGYVRGLAEDLV